MREFTYTGLPVRAVFGVGASAGLADELDRIGIARALLLTTPGRRRDAEAIVEPARTRIAGAYEGARAHVPAQVVAEAGERARALEADGTVAIGGGSTIGLGKALALELGLPQLAVPTTYAGSEMTPVWGRTEAGAKATGRDPRVLPRTALYDPALTLGLPPAISGASGLNAIAHCVEALYAPDESPLASLIADEGVRALAAGLPRVAGRPDDVEARADCLYGAWLAGLALGSTRMGLHHKLCHVLGGSFDLPHAETHAIVLPHAAAYNRAAAPEAMAHLAASLGVEDGPRGLFELARRIGAPPALKEIGMPEEGLEAAASQAARTSYENPAAVTEAGVRALLRAAYAGEAPSRAASPGQGAPVAPRHARLRRGLR